MNEDNIETESNNSVILYDLTSYSKWTSEINLSKVINFNYLVHLHYLKNVDFSYQ